MKSINKRRTARRRIPAVLCTGLLVLSLAGCSSADMYTEKYEREHYNRSLYKGELFAGDLCVTDSNVLLPGYTGDVTLHAAGLFDIKNEKVLYADRLFDQLYPASTTKIMTAYVALKYGNLDDMVTVSERATSFAPDEQVCGLQTGDQISMKDLLAGLLLFSGNDCAIAIAEHVSGNVEAFVEKMNEEAKALGATNTHFVNPHGLQDSNHYTTAYDLYLMFNACTKDQRFIDLLSETSYTASLISSDGIPYTLTWTPTNYYAAGLEPVPEGVRVLGGKTGTTDEAGSCLILYNQDLENNPYISIVMGASDKEILYNNMTQLMQAGIV